MRLDALLHSAYFRPGQKIGIYTDSRSLCSQLEAAARKYTPLPAHGHDIAVILRYLVKVSSDTTITWVPGHQSIGFNNLADEQANYGHNSKQHYKLALTKSSLYGIARRDLEVDFKEHLRNEVTNSKLCREYPDRADFKTPDDHTHLGRSSLTSILFKIRTGHMGVRTHMKRVNSKLQDTTCRFCGEAEETIDHLILSCRELGDLELIRHYFRMTFDAPIQLHLIATQHKTIGPSLLIKANFILRKHGVWV